MGFQIIPRQPSFGERLGGSLGGGLSQGISRGLETGMDYATKLGVEKAKKQEKLKLLNTIFGGGLSGEAAPASKIGAELRGGIPELSADQVLKLYSVDPSLAKGYLDVKEFSQKQQERGLLDQYLLDKEEISPKSQSLMKKAEEPGKGISEASHKLGEFEFQPGELPEKSKRLPAVGELKSEAKIQADELNYNKNKINDFTKNYSNFQELQDNERAAIQAKDLIYNKDINPGFMKKAMIGLTEGIGFPEFKKLFTTPDEQKLAALIMKFARPKDIGGSNPSTREVLLALERYPDILNSPEANKFLIDELVRRTQMDVSKSKLMSYLKKYDPSMDPTIFEDLVNTKMSEYGNKIPGLFDFEMKSEARPSSQVVDVIGPDGQEYEIDESEVSLLPQGFRLK